MKTRLLDRDLRLSLREKGLARAKQFARHTAAEQIWRTSNEI